MRTSPRSTRSVLTAYAFAVVTVAFADDQWFPFTPGGGSLEPGVIGMADWLEKPAGARGGVRMRGDEFIFEDGTPVKFWGANLQFTDCMPEKALGERMATRFAKYGLNAIRLHKIMEPDWAGFGHPDDSTKYDAAKLDRFDHFTAALKSNGIYYGISWVFHHSIRPGDRDKVIAYDEIKAQKGETSRVLVFIAEDVQNLRIQMLVNLLMHTNPYTRVTYAHDPAVNFVEFQNEDSIFFYTFNGFDDLKTLPTYKKLFIKRYSAWLRNKYGSHAGLVNAWGTNAMNVFAVKDEHLDKNNIMPTGNPWMFSPEGLAQGTSRGIRARLLDNAQFLYEVQKAFYDKFTKAVRDTGYKGPLVGSCWTTPAGLPSYYNLLTDYQVGVIDRHNYFGGQDGYSPHTGPFKNTTHLDKPGSGLLSFGLHQAVDRPFQLSEWNTVFPDQWALESPTLVAAYGIGLQGWDASYQFTASARDTMWDIVAGNQNFVVDRIDQIGLYPLLARMIQRGDMKQGGIISERRVSPAELADGKPDFIQRESSKNEGDFKEAGSGDLVRALAAGRVVIAFTNAPAQSVWPDMPRYKTNGTIRSITGQLQWTVLGAQKGFVTINTPGTQAAVGFLPPEPIVLDNVTFTPATPFCGLYLTSLDRKNGIAESKRCLLAAMARVRNTGMKFNDAMTELLAVGKAPLLIEPVNATVAITNRAIASVELLDHSGLRTGTMLPVTNSTFKIDGTRDRTMYYEVVFE